MRIDNAFWVLGLCALGCQSPPVADPSGEAGEEVEPSGGDDGLPPEPVAAPDSAGFGDPTRSADGQGATAEPGGAGDACGGIAGLSCADPLYCQYPLKAQCGAADQMGECRAVPEMCTMDYRPVCGCDGKTYPNACGAHSAAVSVALDEPCAEDSSR